MVVRDYNRRHPNSTLLLVSDNDLADARGTVYQNNWHQWDTWTKIQNAVNLPQMIDLVNAWKLQYFIGRNEARNSPDESRGLRQFLAHCTQTEFEHDGVFLAKPNGLCAEVPEPAPATPGTYDDFDPALRYRGKWIHSDEFPAAGQRTVSYSDTRGAEAALVFEGQSLAYVYTRAPNRGFAEILIDGVSHGVLDLYAPRIEWQSRYRVCCLAPGRHIAVIRTLGQARKEATGRFADVDELIVE